MKVENRQNYYKRPQFKGFTTLMMNNVFLNKALFDLTGSDIPWVAMANNKEERRERLNRASLSISLIFISPLLALPFVNRFAMKHIAKLTPKMFSKDYNAIRLSNKYLRDEKATKRGLKLLSKKSFGDKKIDVDLLLKNADGSYEKLRKKIINAKNFVLASDFLLVAGSFGHMGFFNNWLTEKKTGQIGYSAEMSMADKETVEKRAKKFKRNEKIRYTAFLAGLGALIVALPLAIKHGLISPKTNKINNFIKNLSPKFDYTDAIFMKRLPLALSMIGIHSGFFMASRNNTERKDNIIRSTSAFAIFFGGDLLLSSLLGQASDKLFGTKLMTKPKNKTFLNKILPPMKDLKDLKLQNCPKTLKSAKIIFWFNFVSLAALMGIITPALINKIIKKDVSKDVKKSEAQPEILQNNRIKRFEDFIK